MKITNSKVKKYGIRKGNNVKRNKGRVISMITEKVAEGKVLLDAAWKFAKTVLWNGQQFSEQEITLVKMKLLVNSLTAPNPENIFHEFCQRILLAKQILVPASGGELPLPSTWFDKSTLNGYAATEGLMKELTVYRKSVPAAMPELNMMARAITEFAKEPTTEKFRQWKEQLQLAKALEMSLLFQLFAANWQYDR
jgi:hypothetical protein